MKKITCLLPSMVSRIVNIWKKFEIICQVISSSINLIFLNGIIVLKCWQFDINYHNCSRYIINTLFFTHLNLWQVLQFKANCSKCIVLSTFILPTWFFDNEPCICVLAYALLNRHYVCTYIECSIHYRIIYLTL